MTCLCILAVDFRIFPRRFAKTETFGVSLMDIGVGIYIVSSALTSKYARGIKMEKSHNNISSSTSSYPSTINHDHNNSINDPMGNDYTVTETSSHHSNGSVVDVTRVVVDENLKIDTNYNIIDQNIHFSEPNLLHMKNSDHHHSSSSSSSCCSSNHKRVLYYDSIKAIVVYLCYSLPFQRFLVLLMGFGRLIILKLIKYQEHVSEYGMHWNFFMTLFVVWTCSDLIHRLISKRFLLSCSILWIILYQILLIMTSLTDYILHAPRTNIIAMNKEGICSLLGYIPLYIITECLSNSIFFDNYSISNHNLDGSNADEIYNDSYSSNIGSSSSNNSTSNSYYLNIRNQLSCKVKRQTNNINNNNNHINTTSTTTASPQILVIPSLQVDDDYHNSNITNGSNYSNDNNDNNSQMKSSKVNGRMMKQLSITISMLWIAWIISAAIIQPTSRRLVNATYVFLVLALSMTILLAMYVVEVYTCYYCSSFNISVMTLHYMSKHSLVIFMVANILTGVINMTIRTIYTTRIFAILILSGYSMTIVLTAWFLEYLSTIRSSKALR